MAAKTEKNRSFDIQGGENEPDVISAIVQSHNDLKKDFGGAAAGIILKLNGNRAFLEYHSYDTSLDNRGRLEDLCKSAEKILGDYLKALKKAIKKSTKVGLKFKELKELKNYTVDKVSLNDRWYLRFWRVYEISNAPWDEDE